MDKPRNNSELSTKEPLQNAQERCYDHNAYHGFIRAEGKTCNWCGIWKPTEEYGLRKQRKSGRSGTCKSCLARKRRQSRSKATPKSKQVFETGIHLNLHLKQTEKFWRGYSMLLDWMADEIFEQAVKEEGNCLPEGGQQTSGQPETE